MCHGLWLSMIDGLVYSFVVSGCNTPCPPPPTLEFFSMFLMYIFLYSPPFFDSFKGIKGTKNVF